MRNVLTELTISERSCMLRAIHGRQKELFGELERCAGLVGPGRPDAEKEIADIRVEIECLHSAIRKLWIAEAAG